MSWEYNQYLAHHGIKGQRWGIRRYQKEDGTLTEEGRKRYSEELNKTISKYDESIKNNQKELSHPETFDDDPEMLDLISIEMDWKEVTKSGMQEVNKLIKSKRSVKVSDIDEFLKTIGNEEVAIEINRIRKLMEKG